MDRLTSVWGENCELICCLRCFYGFGDKCTTCKKRNNVIAKLAAYEKTGLNPEEILHWISVEENLPQPEIVYLVFIDGIGTELAYFTKKGTWRALDSVYYTGEVTHWMPRPKPPKEA